MIPLLGPAHIGQKVDSGSNKKTALGAVLAASDDRVADTTNDGALSVCVQAGQPFAQRIQRRLGAVRQVQLAQDIADVRADRSFADEQPLPDLLVRQPPRHFLSFGYLFLINLIIDSSPSPLFSWFISLPL